MLLDEGILKIYKVVPVKTDTGKPEKRLQYYDQAWYATINSSISEYYRAKQADVEIEKRVEILQNKGVNTKDIIVINEEQYEVR